MKVWLLWSDQGYGENKWMCEVFESEDAARVAMKFENGDFSGHYVEERDVVVDPEKYIERSKAESERLSQYYSDRKARRAAQIAREASA